MGRTGIQNHSRARVAFAGIPASFSCALGLVLAAAIGVPFAASPNRLPKPAPPPPPLPQVEVRVQAVGVDSQNRAMPFTIYILSQRFSWILESTTELEGGATLLDPELSAAVKKAREVFCIGTASFEGGRAKEEARAARRAEELSRWIGPALTHGGGTRVILLNVGQYIGPESLESSAQRKAVLIAAADHDDGVDLAEALASGLRRKQNESPVISSLLHHYSRSKGWLKGLRVSEKSKSAVATAPVTVAASR